MHAESLFKRRRTSGRLEHPKLRLWQNSPLWKEVQLGRCEPALLLPAVLHAALDEVDRLRAVPYARQHDCLAARLRRNGYAYGICRIERQTARCGHSVLKCGQEDRGVEREGGRHAINPSKEQWQAVLEAAKSEPLRNRLMLALAYDAALRREELCLLRTDDLDPAHRTLSIRAETTKTRRARVVPYSAITGSLLRAYLDERRALSSARGPLFLSTSRRNRAAPLTLWTWSKVVRAIGDRAEVPRFSTHTLRHLCLTDLARAGWELHTIATFAGHASLASTLQYIHLSGRDLAVKLARGMAEVHAWRIAQIDEVLGEAAP